MGAAGSSKFKTKPRNEEINNTDQTRRTPAGKIKKHAGLTQTNDEAVNSKTTKREKELVKQGVKIIAKINDMSMELENMPENIKVARSFRFLYDEIHYNMPTPFLQRFLDHMLKKGIVPCFKGALQRIQTRWPLVFNGASSKLEKQAISDKSQKLDPQDVTVFDADTDANAVANAYEDADVDADAGDADVDDDSNTAAAEVWDCLNSIAISATDICEPFRIKAGEQGLLEYYLMEFVPATTQPKLPGKKTIRGKLLVSGVTTIYNCSTSPENISFFEQYSGVEKLLILTSTSNDHLNMLVLFTLAFLIEDKNNHMIMSSNQMIDRIIKCFNAANRHGGRSYDGWSNVEIANALNKIAVNNQNNKMIGKSGGIDSLVEMFKCASSDEERVAATRTLWMLFFDDDNKELFKTMENAIETFSAYLESENKKLREALSGMFWELNMKDRQKEDLQAGNQETHGREKHLMISYNWDHQPTMLKIRDTLRQQGYKIWMDVDKIGGSTLQAMATAVEESSAILMDISRRYKDSANCRSEAEYAFIAKKDIIPIMLETNYKPDGWLGIVLGAKYWIDFASVDNFDVSMSKLAKEVGERGKSGNELITAVDEIDMGAVPDCNQTSRRGDVLNWSESDVKTWLAEKNISEKFFKKSILQKLTGEKLVSLNELQRDAPEFFFNSIKTQFKFPDLLDLLNFTDALKKLMH